MFDYEVIFWGSAKTPQQWPPSVGETGASGRKNKQTPRGFSFVFRPITCPSEMWVSRNPNWPSSRFLAGDSSQAGDLVKDLKKEVRLQKDNGNIENSSASLGKTRISRDFLFCGQLGGPHQPVMLALKGDDNLLKGYLKQASHRGHVFFPMTRWAAT